MSFYDATPFAPPPRLLVPGLAEYFFGKNRQTVSPTQMYVSSVAIAANVATLGVTVFGGDPPAVGSLISVRGSQTGGGTFNVQNIALSSVTLNSAGVGTVTFALVAGNVATTADAGLAIVPQPIQYETIANGASVPIAMSNSSFGGDLNGKVAVEALFGTLPTGVTIVLQGANVNQDVAYTTLGNICVVSGSAIQSNGLIMDTQFLFYRALVSGLSGAGTFAVPIGA